MVVHGRSSGRAEAVAAAITVAGGHAEVARGDLATDAGANAVVAKATEGGTIDILVNNAGYYHHLNRALPYPTSGWRPMRSTSCPPCA
ncbi:SDR family NAD(P)-dependent oxidoreductase [Paraburkholderia kirstenboschensis]|uniref:SDR family NAD(P)-dependent oxidoreductase n=1 Tax=Paraburkholderia kirstenboschensis TaxID=1245436 RepID=A0ABZ0EEQ9_9BURK|nr:SDR family NAD(P)-dependent oxidoreductase [Paraburkholderia kirstenboschensis]WOD14687.1 SDR family NAD(P)-dependent oxidoreductase [Paraburkholderia kirstenboschensis]WOD14717.1 SDR family NAD(P)-dependent oxidoreductase [Paraburkholderia kirstenboschensis]